MISLPTSSNENEDRLKSDDREDSRNIDDRLYLETSRRARKDREIDGDRADRASLKAPWERMGEIDETALEKLRDDGKIRGHGWHAYTNTLEH